MKISLDKLAYFQGFMKPDDFYSAVVKRNEKKRKN